MYVGMYISGLQLIFKKNSNEETILLSIEISSVQWLEKIFPQKNKKMKT